MFLCALHRSVLPACLQRDKVEPFGQSRRAGEVIGRRAAMERYRRRESCASALVGAWRRFDLVVQVIQRDSVHFQNCAAGQAEALKLQASPL
jgi:hypothetical protein